MCASYTADIGADSDLLAMIRGEYSTAENLLRTLEAVSSHEVAVAVDIGVTCERRLLQRPVGSGGRSGAANASQGAVSLDELERREEAERQARLQVAFDNDNAVDAVADMMLASDESTLAGP